MDKTLNVKKLYKDSKLPHKATEGSAGLDLYVHHFEWDEDNKVFVYYTGIAVEIPENHVGLLFPRSSVSNTRLTLANCVGVIDSDYRGEIKAKFYERMINGKIYGYGERCCQLVIIPYLNVSINEVNELTSTKRGEKGFGSTGKT